MLSSEGGLYECSVHREKLQLNKLLDSPIAAAIVISSSQILYSNLENHQLCLYDKHTCKVKHLVGKTAIFEKWFIKIKDYLCHYKYCKCVALLMFYMLSNQSRRLLLPILTAIHKLLFLIK